MDELIQQIDKLKWLFEQCKKEEENTLRISRLIRVLRISPRLSTTQTIEALKEFKSSLFGMGSLTDRELIPLKSANLSKTLANHLLLNIAQHIWNDIGKFIDSTSDAKQ